MGLLAYDRCRLESLRLAAVAALDDLNGIGSDDAAAADAMIVVRNACRTLNELCLPRVQEILNSDPLSLYHRVIVGGNDIVRHLSVYAMSTVAGWEIAADPLNDNTSLLTAEAQQHRRDELHDSATDRTGGRSVATAAAPRISSVTKPLTCNDAALPFLCKALGFDDHDPLVRTVQMAALLGLGGASSEADGIGPGWGEVTSVSAEDALADLSKIKDFRRSAKVGANRTAALGELSVEGVNESELPAASGEAMRKVDVGLPSRRHFEVDDGWENHSEVKILEKAASLLDEMPSWQRTGRLRITVDTTSSMGVCVSCQRVAEQFYAQYPGIELEIVLIDPAPLVN